MTSAEPLENLVKVGQLKREPPSKGETEGLLCRAKNKVVVEYALRHLKRQARHLPFWA